MHIGSLFALSLALIVLPPTSAWAHERHGGTPEPTRLLLAPPVQVLMIGEIIDPQCYFTHAGEGKEHASCARLCARGGQDLSFLDEKTGRVYPLIAIGHGKNPNDTVLALAGERTEVRGTVYGRGQNVVLAIESAEVASSTPKVITGSSSTAVQASDAAKASVEDPQSTEFKIAITSEGFIPATVAVPAGKPVVLVFTRRTSETCATEAIFRQLNRRVDLPLNQPVRVALGPQKAGRIEYACAMNMVRGTVVVR